MAKNVVAELGFIDVVIYEYDKKTKLLSQVAAHGNKSPAEYTILSPIEVPLNRGVVGRVATLKTPLIIPDTRLFDDYIVDDKVRLSELAVPLLVDDEVIGVIDSEHDELNFFTDAHLNTLTAIASIAALKVSQKMTVGTLRKAVEKLKRSAKVQDSLFEIAELIFKTDTIDEFYSGVHACIKNLTLAENLYIAQVSDSGCALDFPYYQDEFEEGYPHGLIPIDPSYPSITSYVLSENKPCLLYRDDVVAMIDAKKFSIEGEVPAAWLGVPFGTEASRGIVVIQSYSESLLFDENDKIILSFVAKHIHNALERKNATLRMQFLALHDPLTELPNRELFQNRVQRAMVACDNNRRSDLAILLIDLDRFKQINDTYGHHTGDHLLLEVAKILSECVRETDTVSRLGGDEFAIMLEDSRCISAAEKVAEKIIMAFKTSLTVDSVELTITVSIGIAEYKVGSDNQDQLFFQADNAMYQAKLRGRNQYVISFSNETSTQLSIAKLSREFSAALINKDFFLEYQPIIDFSTGRMYAVEALVRWRHETLGDISPANFIPELERSGQIVRLDQYVIEQTLDKLHTWSAWLPWGFKVNVNISTAGLSSKKLMANLELRYSESPSLFDYLCFEITEESLAVNVSVIQKTMTRLRQMGVALALDDFGTGYSSLSYLHQFDFDILKIDKSFTHNMDHGSDKGVIIEAIVGMAKSLNKWTVAEGIETAEQYKDLQGLGCDGGQGYYMARPQSENDIRQLVQSNERLPT